MIAILASTPTRSNVLFIIGTCCSFVFCHFKCSSSLKQDGFWLAVIVFINHQLENNRFKSNSNNIVPLCCYRYSCGGSFTFRMIFIYKNHNYSYCLWCERALWKHLKHWQMLQLIHFICEKICKCRWSRKVSDFMSPFSTPPLLVSSSIQHKYWVWEIKINVHVTYHHIIILLRMQCRLNSHYHPGITWKGWTDLTNMMWCDVNKW